jgi:flagellar hook-associated protein 1 FlgK
MSLSASLNAATRGLDLSARRAELIASNVSRADDPDYAKRRLETDGTTTGTSVRRVVNPAEQQMRREAQGEAARAGIAQAFATDLDRMIGDPDQRGSLQDGLARFSAALTLAASDPTSEPALDAIRDAARDVAMRLNGLAEAVTVRRQAAETAIAGGVERLNADLRAVEDVNAQIVKADALGQDSSTLRDRRAMHINSISEAVPVRRLDRGDGSIGLVTLGGAILLDGKAATVGFEARQGIAPDQVFPTTLNELTLRDRPAGTGRAGEFFAGGALAAEFAIRDDAAPTAMSRLDAFAQELAIRMQDSDLSLAAPNPGPFTDGGLRVGATPEPGLAARLALDDRLNDRGARLFRDGMDGPIQANANDQLLRFAEALDARQAPQSDTLGSGPSDMIGLAGRLRSAISSDRVAADRSAELAVREADRLIANRDGGVISVDEEMQRLLRVEQAYAANARLIQAVSQMMDRLTEM